MERTLLRVLQIYLFPLLCFGAPQILNPLRISSTPGTAHFNSITTLPGLSCDDTAMKCIAVGYSQNATATQPLSYTTTDGGISWSSPNQLAQISSRAQSFLLGINCSKDGIRCTAIGASLTLDTGIPLCYTTDDGGATWSAPHTLATPENTHFNALLNIFCDTKNQNCVAVGYSNTPGNEIPLIYNSHNHGADWNYIQPILPENAFTGVLLGVACDSALTQCLAVGYANTGNLIIPISYYSKDRGLSWSTSTLLPIPTQATASTLVQVNCDANSGLHCIAIGSARLSGHEVPLSYQSTDGGVSWGNTILLTPPVSAASSGLNALHCDSSTLSCIAMGYTLNNGIVHPLNYFSANGEIEWSDATLLTSPYEENNSLTLLFQLTCDNRMLHCLTVGNYINATSVLPLSYYSETGGISWGVPLLLQIPSP
ncbi:sialidase family protein [Legionella lytica]|uniref:Sialidase family protein n=1 Tax=Legionella lytica TaxID=96232 RepID=A0ABW8D702_9GAMM